MWTLELLGRRGQRPDSPKASVVFHLWFLPPPPQKRLANNSGPRPTRRTSGKPCRTSSLKRFGAGPSYTFHTTRVYQSGPSTPGPHRPSALLPLGASSESGEPSPADGTPRPTRTALRPRRRTPVGRHSGHLPRGPLAQRAP